MTNISIAPYLEKLRQIQEEIARANPNFPANCCTESALKAYKKIGLDIDAGKLRWQDHTWNWDRERNLYVDITAGQFGLPDIIVLPRKEAIEKYAYFPNPTTRKNVLAFTKPSKTQTRLEEFYAWQREFYDEILEVS
ncbi:MAG: hypothetical protein KKF56_02795 [Nanoarchaeota archaeon]|nr:hypothetical protein [Nanoarchaeota archaeon]